MVERCCVPDEAEYTYEWPDRSAAPCLSNSTFRLGGHDGVAGMPGGAANEANEKSKVPPTLT